jgi:hypothetical protein
MATAVNEILRLLQKFACNKTTELESMQVLRLEEHGRHILGEELQRQSIFVCLHPFNFNEQIIQIKLLTNVITHTASRDTQWPLSLRPQLNSDATLATLLIKARAQAKVAFLHIMQHVFNWS